MHHQFNIQQLYALPTLYLCVCIYLRTNSDLCHLQHKLIGFYNRDEKCSLRGTNWVFKQSSLRFVFKGGSTLVTLPLIVTPYRDSVDGTRVRVTYQKLVTR